MPGTSNINVRAGRTRPNLVVSRVGIDGKVNVATGGAFADVAIDIAGWFETSAAPESGYRPSGPTRLFDSRLTRARLRPGVPIDITTEATEGGVAIVNIVAVDAAGGGFVTVWPAGQPRPGTSNLNVEAGDTVANLALVGAGTGAKVSVMSSVATDIVADSFGAIAGGFTPQPPTRLLDTRSTARRFSAGETRSVQTGAPPGSSVALNLTAVSPRTDGFVSLWPHGLPRPTVSNVNATAGKITPNAAMVQVGESGLVDVYTMMDTDIVIDLFATSTDSSGYHGVAPTRIVDTRAVLRPSNEVRHAFPVGGPTVSYSSSHAGYPATDLFAPCGAPVVSPVDGVVSHVRRVDSYSPTNPATFGGRSVAIVGDDGVRYYGSHFDVIEPAIAVGQRVAAGARLGTIGLTGDSRVCHLHFGMSVPCPGSEWKVRRGTVWPWPYLDAWRAGRNPSPRDEIETWRVRNPAGCWTAMLDPFAPAVG